MTLAPTKAARRTAKANRCSGANIRMTAQIVSALKEKVVRKKLLALLFTVGIGLGLAATASAQELNVTVPFDFVVAGKTLPSATYSIGRPLVNDSTGLFFLGDRQGVMARASEIDSTITGTKLVFHKIGDEYFLSDVVTQRGTLHFPVSSREKTLAQDVEIQTVTLAAGN